MNTSINRIILIVLSLSPSLISLGQTEIIADSTKLDSLQSKVVKLQKTLDEIKKIVASDTSKNLSIGTFKLYSTKDIRTYCFNTYNITRKECATKENSKYRRSGICTSKVETSLKVNITKVIIDICDGVINDIQVQTAENKTFSNNMAPIELNRFNERCDLLRYYDGNKIFYLQCCDILTWERDGNYSPDDIRIELTKKDEIKLLPKSTGINSIFNIRLYSDMLGTFGNESNGLVQTEASLKTPVNSNNFKNKPFFFLNYFTIDFRLSKFDNKFKYTDVNYNNSDTVYTSSDTTFSRKTFYQRNWLNLQIGFNLFSGQFSNKSRNSYALDLIGGFAISNFASATDSGTFALPYLGFNPNIKIIPAPNFGITLSSQFLWQYAPQLKNKGFGQEKKIVSPAIELFWNPLGSIGNKIFIRAKYVAMVQDNDPFWQVQLGYNLSLSEIINKKLDYK